SSFCGCWEILVWVTRTGTDIYTEVKLKLVQDSCCDTVTKVQSYEGYSESVSCTYESQYQNNLKYICRGNQPSTCLQQALITSDTKQNGRFKLDDDKVLGKFTVNINSLVKSDSGSYLCGVQRNSDLDVFSAVELKVKEWCCVKSTQINGTVGHPLTLQCPYPPQHRDNRKFLLMITKMQADDAGTYWCRSDSQWSPGNYTKIQLSVVFQQHTGNGSSTVKTPAQISDAGQYVVYTVPAVLLVLICVLVLIVYKCKHQKAKGNKALMNRNTSKTGGLQEVMGAAENGIYGNDEVVRYSEKQTSKTACNDYHDAGEDEPDYENVTQSEEIYCNEDCHKANRR
uniref:Immunoglobulin domain-containing protein n=1 Tax=Oreochromis aureus TaxID=47969 RepID=A0AAZ1X244_OREAU